MKEASPSDAQSEEEWQMMRRSARANKREPTAARTGRHTMHEKMNQSKKRDMMFSGHESSVQNAQRVTQNLLPPATESRHSSEQTDSTKESH